MFQVVILLMTDYWLVETRIDCTLVLKTHKITKLARHPDSHFNFTPNKRRGYILYLLALFFLAPVTFSFSLFIAHMHSWMKKNLVFSFSRRLRYFWRKFKCHFLGIKILQKSVFVSLPSFTRYKKNVSICPRSKKYSKKFALIR